jgi:hypothetical protein
VSGTLRIDPVAGAKDLDAFVRLPWQLLGDDPNWVPPLLMDRRQQLSPKHPFFRHASWQGFLARRDGALVGRISAQIDRRNAEQGRPGLGYFGMLDAVDDAEVHAALLRAAEGWLAERGCTRVEGPFNLNVNQELGQLIEGFDTPPYFMMPHGPRWTGGHLEAAGYEKAVDLLAYVMDPDFERPPAMARVVSRLGDRLRVRPLDRRHAEDDLRAMCAIFNDAWSANWGFLPFSEEEFLAIGKEMLLVIEPDQIQLGELEGEPTSFAVLLPNLNEAIRDLNGRLLPFGWAKLLWRLKVRYPSTGRVPLMGVRRAFQGGRTGAALAFGVIDGVRAAAVRRGMHEVEMSWILEENLPMRHILEGIGGRVSKRYRMYGRPLGRTSRDPDAALHA